MRQQGSCRAGFGHFLRFHTCIFFLMSLYNLVEICKAPRSGTGFGGGSGLSSHARCARRPRRALPISLAGGRPKGGGRGRH